MMHIGLGRDNSAKYALLPGNPDRCSKIAEHLDRQKKITQNREHTSFEGYLEGEKVLVVSTGMGGPSSSICLEELVKIGADTFIRIGSCASTSKQVCLGDVVIPNGIVRMEGTGLHYLPMEFPAVPNFEIIGHLEKAAVKLGYDPKIGVSIAKDSFYTQIEPDTKPVGYELVNRWNAYVKGGAESTSMESAALFIVAASLGVRAATVLVSATSLDTSLTTDRKKTPVDIESRVIKVGIEGLRNLIKSDNRETNYE